MTDEASTKKETLQRTFDRTASGYGGIRYFPIFGRWLVDSGQIHSGNKVLDVACGRGAVLFPAAEKVGQQGQVIGIDLSEAMARETNEEIQKRGLRQAQAMQMDAEQLQFSDETFDRVLCGFSLQFFPHLAQALSEFHRVLKPQGVIAATTWGDDDHRWDWYDELLVSYGATVKLSSQSFDKPEHLHDWFSRAGFVETRVISKEVDLEYTGADEWWSTRWNISGRAGLELLSPEKLEQLKAEVFEQIAAHNPSGEIRERLAAHCTIAVKP